MPRGLLCALVAAAALAGCGGDAEPTAAPATPSPLPSVAPGETAAPTPSATATEEPTPVSPEDQPGGAGDEQEARVPVELTIRDGGITPPEVSVPAFLAIELIVHNETADQLVVRLEGAEPLSVDAAQTARARLEGRRKGEYAIDAAPYGEAVLITGVEPGP